MVPQNYCLSCKNKILRRNKILIWIFSVCSLSKWIYLWFLKYNTISDLIKSLEYIMQQWLTIWTGIYFFKVKRLGVLHPGQWTEYLSEDSKPEILKIKGMIKHLTQLRGMEIKRHRGGYTKHGHYIYLLSRLSSLNFKIYFFLKIFLIFMTSMEKYKIMNIFFM